MWTPEQFIWAADHIAWTGFQVWIAVVGVHLLLGMIFGDVGAGDDE